MKANNSGFYKGAIIAKLLGVTHRRLQQMSADGIIPRPENGMYSLYGCVTKYIEFIKQNTAGRSQSDYTRSRLSLTIEQTKKLQRENDKAEQQLIPRDEVLEVTRAASKIMSDVCMKFCTPEVAKELCSIDEPALVREKLKQVEQDVRNEVAEKFIKMAERGK